MEQSTNIKAYVTEFLGTFLIVYSTLISYNLFGHDFQYLPIALITGMVYSVVLWVGLGFSGAHYNPCITAT